MGVQIGPDQASHSWDKPGDKYLQRLGEWPWSQMGLQPSIITYNAYILPVLTFVAQVEPPPADLHLYEEQALRQIAPGAGN